MGPLRKLLFKAYTAYYSTLLLLESILGAGSIHGTENNGSTILASPGAGN
jgi:hypothetical protein